jgi:nicotinamide mononucleotide adenylyltransferase
MTETTQRRGGGKPFRSIMEPHFEFIRELRQRRKTWRQITELLFTEKGIRVTVYAPYLFYRRKLKRAAKPHWENAGNDSEAHPVRPIIAASRQQSRPSPLAKPAPFNRPNINNINTDQEFT